AGDGRYRARPSRLGTRSRYQDHVHHRLRRGGVEPGFQRAEAGQGAVEADPPAGVGHRSAEDAGGGLIRLALAGPLPRRGPADKTTPLDGRVAQRKSTTLTWRGSQVRSLSRPPSPQDIISAWPFRRRQLRSP